MSTVQRTNTTDRDLEKFIKFLVLKSVQVVVQSRLGEKMQTSCSPQAGNDWFNIVVDDHPEVYTETKRVLMLGASETILSRFPMCIEISLKTSDGDQMILEVWSLDLRSENTNVNTNGTEQQCLKAAHAIYNRMGILLKSLISLTRAIPAYKLSRRQSPDSYGLYYRLYVDQPQLINLGEGFKAVRIGQLNTILGNLVLSVAYRTKMTITPSTTVQTRIRDANAIIMDSNHFLQTDVDLKQQPSAGLNNKKNGLNCERKTVDIDKPLRPGAFTDTSKLRQYTEEDYVLPEVPPFKWLLYQIRQDSGNNDLPKTKSNLPESNNLKNHKCENKNISTTNSEFKVCDNNNVNIELNQLQNSSSVKSLFVSPTSTLRHKSETVLPSITVEHNMKNDEENLLKELYFPFASPNSHVNDLAKFYRDCYHAPSLTSLCLHDGDNANNKSVTNDENKSVSNSTTEDHLTKQLELFETSLEEYDKLVSQLSTLTTSSSNCSLSGGALQKSN